MMRPDKYVMGSFRKSLDFLVGFVIYNLPSSLLRSSSSTIYKQHHLLGATSNYALISSLAHEFSHFHKSCVNETETTNCWKSWLLSSFKWCEWFLLWFTWIFLHLHQTCFGPCAYLLPIHKYHDDDTMITGQTQSLSSHHLYLVLHSLLASITNGDESFELWTCTLHNSMG